MARSGGDGRPIRWQKDGNEKNNLFEYIEFDDSDVFLSFEDAIYHE